ncbi:MAG TPA: hypothetical protein VGX78_06755 [Pirellulales bacterium]|nr:hypothetical protein [Pirellulales bacterium]
MWRQRQLALAQSRFNRAAQVIRAGRARFVATSAAQEAAQARDRVCRGALGGVAFRRELRAFGFVQFAQRESCQPLVTLSRSLGFKFFVHG